MESITARLDRLEKRNRRLTWCNRFLLVACVIVVFGAAAGPERVLEGERFVLKDKVGRTRAELSTDAAGSTALHLYDRAGTGRLRMGIESAQDGEPNDEASIAVSDSAGRDRIVLQNTFLGVPQLSFYDDAGHSRLDVTIDDANDSLAIDLCDRKDTPRFSLVGSAEDGVGMHFTVKGVDEPKSRLSFVSTNEGVGITLFDDAEKERINLQVGPTGQPSIKVLAPDGRAVFELPKP